MDKDFYLDQRGLAAYIEKDWADLIFQPDSRRFIDFEYPKFDLNLLYSPFHQDFVNLIDFHLGKNSLSPESMLEIGSSLGRTFFEVCKKVSSLKSATLVEPSQLLASCFAEIFSGDEKLALPILKGNRDLQNVEFDSRQIRSICGNVDFSCLNSEFKELKFHKPFDLVICSNVIDQCHDPLGLVCLLQDSTNQGGLLAISCTYQWQKKYLEPSSQNIARIGELFRSEWKLLGENDIEFKVRRSERYWETFLSHASIFRKN